MCTRYLLSTMANTWTPLWQFYAWWFWLNWYILIRGPDFVNAYISLTCFSNGKHMNPSVATPPSNITQVGFNWVICQYVNILHFTHNVNFPCTFSNIGEFSCHGNYYSFAGRTKNPSSFGPPGFPALIASSTRQYCRWSFYGTTGTRYQFRLMYFDVPESPSCSRNKLTIRDGYYSISPVIATLCGSISTLAFKSTGSNMVVTLETNSNTFKGFRGVFEAV